MSNYSFDFTPLIHQRHLIESDVQTKALITGYGGGKTLAGSIEIVKQSIINTGCPVMVVSPNYKMAKKTTIPTIKEVLENYFTPQPKFKYNKSDHYFEIPAWNGMIWVGSADNPDSLKGPNLAGVWMDEPGLMDYDAYNVAISRIRHPRAQKLQMILTGTPEGLNWLYDLCEEKRPKNFEVFRGKTTDNTYLPQSYIESLYDQYDEQLVKCYIEGLFVNLASGSAYYSYSQDNIIKQFEPNSNRPILIGMDFNYNPMCSIIAQQEYRDGIPYLIVFDEFFLHNCNTDAACERILDKYGDKCEYQIYPDPACKARTAHGSGKSDLALIRHAFGNTDYHVSVRSTHAKRKDRLNAVNGMLCNAKKKRRLLIHDRCKYLKTDMVKVTMEEYLNANYKDPLIGHITDALGYLVEYRYPVRSGKTGIGHTNITT